MSHDEILRLVNLVIGGYNVNVLEREDADKICNICRILGIFTSWDYTEEDGFFIGEDEFNWEE